MVVKYETGDHQFIDEEILIHTGKENSNEENWIDNFESHSALNN